MRMPIGRPMAPSRDELLGRLERGVVHEALADPQGEPCYVGQVPKLQGFVDGVRDGLLHRDVLSGRQRSFDVRVVQVRGGEDLDRVDVVVGEELVDVGTRPRYPPALGGLAGQRPVDVTDRQHVTVGVLQVSGDVHVGDVPRTENAESELARARALSHRTPFVVIAWQGPTIRRPECTCRGYRGESRRRPRQRRLAPPRCTRYAAAALVYERRSASSTNRLTAGDQKNPTCPPA